MFSKVDPKMKNRAVQRGLARHPAWVLLAAVGLVVAVGCSTKPKPPPKVQAYETYRVGAPDQLSVSILPDPRIEREVVVRPDGMISIDLVGDIPAGGRTVEEIAQDVEKRISRFKRGASVTVAVNRANSTEVTVLGEVRGNRKFPLLQETRVSGVIGMAGGTNAFASLRNVKVIRTGGGETVVYKVNMKAIQAGDLSSDILLTGGDIVYVPPTIWARFGYVVQAMLFPLQPLLGTAQSVAGNLIVP